MSSKVYVVAQLGGAMEVASTIDLRNEDTGVSLFEFSGRGTCILGDQVRRLQAIAERLCENFLNLSPRGL